MFLLENKVVLVTGSSRGIGLTICESFAKEGAKVYAGARNENSIAQQEFASGGSIIPISLDVTNEVSIKDCISRIKKDENVLDVLVNNAGITIIERFDMMRKSSVETIYNTNVFGLLYVTQYAIRLLRKSLSPTIINMSSIMARDSDVGQTAYASSKAAVESMTKTWAKEYAQFGFRVNAIAPGNVNTDMFNIISEQERIEAIKKIGLRRVAEPEEIAKVALFLASNMASYVTGEVINVNGGLVL